METAIDKPYDGIKEGGEELCGPSPLPASGKAKRSKIGESA